MTSDRSPEPEASETSHQRAHTRTVWRALLLDVVLVVLFAAIGRLSHEEGLLGDGGIGMLVTTWPFLVALGVGWLVSVAWRRPVAVLRTGVPVWVVTVGGGMLLRAVSGQGTAVAFVVVATVTLLVFLVGWRGVVSLMRRGRGRRGERL